jgi:hypothetical protein
LTTDAIARQCAPGGVVQWDLDAGRGHGDIDTSQYTWLANGFANDPVTDLCP